MKHRILLFLSMTLSLYTHAETFSELKDRFEGYVAEALKKPDLDSSTKENIYKNAQRETGNENNTLFWYNMYEYGIKTGDREVMDKSFSKYLECESFEIKPNQIDNVPHYKSTLKVLTEMVCCTAATCAIFGTLVKLLKKIGK